MESGARCSSCNGSGVAGDQPVDAPPAFAPPAFACAICKETATDAVVTFCGHMFCWPCLYRWQQGQPKPCPVCSHPLGPSEVIPVHGSSAEGSSADSSIPPRPPPGSLVPRSLLLNSETRSSEDVAAAAADPDLIEVIATFGSDFQADWDGLYGNDTPFSFSSSQTRFIDDGTAAPAAANPIGRRTNGFEFQAYYDRQHANYNEFNFSLFDL